MPYLSLPASPLKETLRHLFLAGNPVALLPFYRERLLIAFGPQLVVLDDLKVTAEEQSGRVLVAHEGIGGARRQEARPKSLRTLVPGDSRGTGGCGEGSDMVHFSLKASGSFLQLNMRERLLPQIRRYLSRFN